MKGRVLLVLCAAIVAVAGAQAATKPALRLVKISPFTVRGAAFAPRERVKVTLVFTETRIRRVRANAAGDFVVSFGEDVPLGRCGAFSVQAVGPSSHVVVLKVPRPACMPVGSP